MPEKTVARVGIIVSVIAVLMTAGTGVWKVAAEFGAIKAELGAIKTELRHLDRRLDRLTNYVLQRDNIPNRKEAYGPSSPLEPAQPR